MRDLGVTALWLSPIYPSPMVDFGYDISDYTAIHLLFGALADFDQLVQAVHAEGLKLILDVVPNHTSDQHPWFWESRCSRTNPKRDWYLNFVKQLIHLRQQSLSLTHGSYLELPVFERDVLAYLRTEGLESVLVALNFSEREKIVNFSASLDMDNF